MLPLKSRKRRKKIFQRDTSRVALLGPQQREISVHRPVITAESSMPDKVQKTADKRVARIPHGHYFPGETLIRYRNGFAQQNLGQNMLLWGRWTRVKLQADRVRNNSVTVPEKGPAYCVEKCAVVPVLPTP